MASADLTLEYADPFKVLPSTVVQRILSHLPLSVVCGQIPLVSQLWLACVNSTRIEKLDAKLQSPGSASSLTRWLQHHGQSLVQASIMSLPLFALHPKTALCSALAVTCSNLQSLSLSLPLSQRHETAVFLALAPLLPKLKAFRIAYTPGPDCSNLCCAATAGPATAAVADSVPESPSAACLSSASQLQQLIVSGAGLACCRTLLKLTALTHLTLPIASEGLDIALLQLPMLRHVDLVSHRISAAAEPSSAAAKQSLSQQLCDGLGHCSWLTTLKLCGFKPASTSSTLLTPLSQLQQLCEVDLAGCLLEARQLLPLSACTRVSRLSLASNNLGWDSHSNTDSSTGNHLLLLLSSLTYLVALDVSGCNLTSLEPIYCCCCSLTALHAGAHRFRYHPNAIDTAGLEGISRLPRLRMLDLSCNRLDSNCLQHLAVLALLTSLSLAENDLGYTSDSCDRNLSLDQALNSSERGLHEDMASSSCSCCQDHPSGLQHLIGLEQLKYLDLSSCCLRGISPLAHLSGLSSLKLGYSGFWQFQYNRLERSSFTAIGRLTGLQYLDLHYCRGQYTRFSIQASSLSNLCSLTYLDVSGCWDACWHVMQPSNHPVSVSDTAHDAGTAGATAHTNGARAAERHLPGRFPHLQELLIMLQGSVVLSRVAACCSSLGKLHMSDGGQQMHDSVNSSMTGLEGLTSLTSLSISSLEELHSFEQVAMLSTLQHLKLFSAAAAPYQHPGIEALTALTHLTCLDLRHGLCGEVEDYNDKMHHAMYLLDSLKQSLPGGWIRTSS